MWPLDGWLMCQELIRYISEWIGHSGKGNPEVLMASRTDCSTWALNIKNDSVNSYAVCSLSNFTFMTSHFVVRLYGIHFCTIPSLLMGHNQAFRKHLTWVSAAWGHGLVTSWLIYPIPALITSNFSSHRVTKSNQLVSHCYSIIHLRSKGW